MKVIELTPGTTDQGGAVYIMQQPHPFIKGYQLTLWRRPDHVLKLIPLLPTEEIATKFRSELDRKLDARHAILR